MPSASKLFTVTYQNPDLVFVRGAGFDGPDFDGPGFDK